jgi:ferrochelatase
MTPAKRAILLLAHGTPETLDDIPEYLKNVTSGRAMPPAVIEEIRHRYGLIGHSPLTEWTFAQAQQLESMSGLPVFVGMRNWRPYIADTVRQMREQNVTETVAICLAPQNSRTSVGLYRRATYAEAGDAMQLSFVDAWADHPLLVRAFAEMLAPVYDAAQQTGARTAVVFTAHSVPCRTIQVAPPPGDEGAVAQRPAVSATPDPYPVEAKLTAALVAAALGIEDWYFAFQSQGMSGGPWIGPTVEDTLRAIKDSGYGNVVVQPVGFLCDHVEILYDIDIAFRDVAEQIGLHLTRAESLNGSPTLTAALADLAAGAFRKFADAPAAAQAR